jgi:mannose-6-phosphate isomerase-like protein (cupin superfamily)
MKLQLITLGLSLGSLALAQSDSGYVTDIDKATLQNEDFRKVLFTGPNSQLVVMSLKPREEIGQEKHKVDQFFRIEQGSAILKMGGKEYRLGKDSAFIVPAGVAHNVRNVGGDELKLYTIYSPPQHPPHTVHQTKADAMEAEAKHG